MSIQEIRVPDIGHFSGVEVIEVSVKEGSIVKPEETLITLETEKASMDVPSPLNGKIQEMKVKVGDKVSQGDLIALIEVAELDQTKAASQEVVEVVESTTQVSSAPKEEVLTVNVPDTGGATDVEVIEVAIKPGDTIPLEGTLITLESEKASMDIPSPYEGKIETVLVKVGDKVTMGAPIATMRVMQQAASTKPVAAVPPSTPVATPQAKLSAPVVTEEKVYTSNASVHAGPATRRMARELGVDLSQVKGSGRKQRIVTKDVQAFVKAVMQGKISLDKGLSVEKAPEIDFSQFGEIEVKPLGRIKKWTAKNLHRNWVTIPHVTQFDDADITDLEVFRQENKQLAEESGVKLTPLAFIIKAVVSGLKTFPQFNASLSASGTDLIFKKYFNIGVAVDTPEGLVVPVLKEVDTKGLFEIAKELSVLSALAREGKLKTDQMQGNCFSITSLGGIGGTAFTPIINAPDVAILGISKAQIKPVYEDNRFVPRRMLPLSLSYDHRVIDGAEAARFITHISEQLKDIRKILL